MHGIDVIGYLKSLLGIEKKSAEGGYELLTGGMMPTASGVPVSPESAMRCGPAFACIRIIGETLQQLPVHLYRRNGDDRERATDHPVYPLVTRAANDWTPASEFRLVLGTHLAAHGNAFAWINRDTSGRPVEMIPLDPRTVSVRQHPVTMAPVYTITAGAWQGREFDRSEILHIRGPGLDIHTGASPVTLAREAISLSLTLETHRAGLFGRGAKPSGLLKHKRTVSPELLKRLNASFVQWFSGGANAGKTLLLECDMDFQQLQLSSVDSQTLEMRRFQVEEISRFWRIPLHMLNELDRTTHNNAEAMGQQFLTFCMVPILTAWCDALSITLLTPEERETFYFEFLVDDIARADLTARMQGYATAIAHSLMCPDEARAKENLPPIPDGSGAVFTRPVNVAPVSPSTSGTGGGDASAA